VLAAPVLALLIKYRVINEIAMTRVLMLPNKIINCFLSSCLCFGKISLPIIAACDAPKPGRNEQIGETRVVAIIGLMSFLFSKINFPIFCSGIFNFCEIE
jgi:hypothetical protein